ncbi:lipoprotein [Mycoplasma mycoides subsp. capri]|uniref:lipoprotein n=1 Tax=Mycoplasma mycoides TaxID=2102 RepID=UPI00224056D0|nr:lipoprotein [Mycoplasma mycoides]QVJ96248.1 lipoprotein [Mycoplasma mycoides subsp. capri]QVJ97142.1 lipoprotein [Mycoplasma mycoides subsp. capri]QVK00125.1 lipoprotein [Mycoplasma mycoides subsp. capri]QVK01007.1 lipoprotein [Mycoplasma mycoides subsp. capri]
MKKLLGILMFGSVTIFPTLTTISCSTTITHTIKTSFNDDTQVEKFVWKDNRYQSDGQSSNIQDVTNSLNGTTNAYSKTVTDVLNLFTRNIQEVRNLKESYDLFRGKAEDTSVVGYYTGANAQRQKISQQDFYKKLDDSKTHISSLKGLLQLREFVKNDKNKTAVDSWKNSLKTNAEEVKKWSDEFTKNLDNIVNSSTENKIKDIKLVSKVSKTSSSFATFEQDVKTAPTTDNKNIDLKNDNNNKVVGDIKNLKDHNPYVFGTSPVNDPFGMNVIGENKDPDISKLKPTINYSTEKLTKKDDSYINLSNNGDSSKFIYNINQKWELSSAHNFYYMSPKEETLELQITHSIENKNFTFYVQFGGLRKIYTPIVEAYTPKDGNSSDKRYSFVGWAFNSYRFSDDFSKGNSSPYRFKDISLKISQNAFTTNTGSVNGK